MWSPAGPNKRVLSCKRNPDEPKAVGLVGGPHQFWEAALAWCSSVCGPCDVRVHPINRKLSSCQLGCPRPGNVLPRPALPCGAQRWHPLPLGPQETQANIHPDADRFHHILAPLCIEDAMAWPGAKASRRHNKEIQNCTGHIAFGRFGCSAPRPCCRTLLRLSEADREREREGERGRQGGIQGRRAGQRERERERERERKKREREREDVKQIMPGELRFAVLCTLGGTLSWILNARCFPSFSTCHADWRRTFWARLARGGSRTSALSLMPRRRRRRERGWTILDREEEALSRPQPASGHAPFTLRRGSAARPEKQQLLRLLDSERIFGGRS